MFLINTYYSSIMLIGISGSSNQNRMQPTLDAPDAIMPTVASA